MNLVFIRISSSTLISIALYLCSPRGAARNPIPPQEPGDPEAGATTLYKYDHQKIYDGTRLVWDVSMSPVRGATTA
eukprot:6233933-Pyramimonas_sp.AAC.1